MNAMTDEEIEELWTTHQTLDQGGKKNMTKTSTTKVMAGLVAFSVFVYFFGVLVGQQSLKKTHVPNERLIDAFEMGVVMGVEADEDLTAEEGVFFDDDIQYLALLKYRMLLESQGQEDNIIASTERVIQMRPSFWFNSALDEDADEEEEDADED